MNKTLAELKREAKQGAISLELLKAGIWKDGVPARIQGKRSCIGANSVGIFLQRADGKGKSECRLPRASLVEYTGDSLKVYRAGYRKPNAVEKKALAEWEAVTETQRYKDNLEYDLLTDYNQCFYEKKRFFGDRGLDYLCGWEESKGCLLCNNRMGEGKEDFIRDASVKGELELEYRVYRNA